MLIYVTLIWQNNSSTLKRMAQIDLLRLDRIGAIKVTLLCYYTYIYIYIYVCVYIYMCVYVKHQVNVRHNRVFKWWHVVFRVKLLLPVVPLKLQRHRTGAM